MTILSRLFGKRKGKTMSSLEKKRSSNYADDQNYVDTSDDNSWDDGGSDSSDSGGSDSDGGDSSD